MALASTLLFASCEEDHPSVQEEQVVEKADFHFEKLNKNDISNRFNLQKALGKAKERLTSSLQTKSYDSLNNVWIDENNVHYVSSGAYESYTFGVYNPNAPDDVNNLMLHKVSDSSFLPILIKYTIDTLDFSNTRVEYKELDDVNFDFQQKNGLHIELCTVSNNCVCWKIDGFDEYGDAIVVIHYSVVNCDMTIDAGISASGGDGDGDPEPGSGLPPDGNGSSSGTGGVDETILVLDCVRFNNGDCADGVTKPILVSVEDILDVQLDNLIDRDNESWTEYDETRTEPSLVFNSFEEFELFREDFLSNFSSTSGNTSNTVQPDGKIRVRAISDLGPAMRISVGCDVNLDDLNTPLVNETTVENVNSSLSGADLFYEYVHNTSQETLDVDTYHIFNVLQVRGDLKVHLTIGNFLRIWTLDTRTTMLLQNIDASVTSAYTELQF